MLEVIDLSVCYPSNETPSLMHLGLQLKAGEILAVLGESGSGKSTFAQALAGTLPAHAVVNGHAHLCGQVLNPLRANSKVSMVFQDALASLHPMRSIASQWRETLQLHHQQSDRDALSELASTVHLPLDCLNRVPHRLSGGQRQRAALGLALATKPLLLIADEATSALDPILANDLLDRFQQLAREQGLGIVIITHQVEHARRMANQLVVLQNGRCVEQGKAIDAFLSPQSNALRTLIESEPKISVESYSVDESTSHQSLSNVLNVRDLHVQHCGEANPVVKGASFELRQGEWLGIAGASGSGKSTLMRAILGLTPLQTGQVAWLGNSSASPRREHTPAQLVFQDPQASLNPRWRVLDLVTEFLRLQGLNRAERDARGLALLNQVGLSTEFANRFSHELSGGQKQRVAIARALACQPQVLVCDEATTALDPSIQAQIIGLLRQIRTDDFSVVMIAHDLRLLLAECDRVLILHQGQIVDSFRTTCWQLDQRHVATLELLHAAGICRENIDLPLGKSAQRRKLPA